MDAAVAYLASSIPMLIAAAPGSKVSCLRLKPPPCRYSCIVSSVPSLVAVSALSVRVSQSVCHSSRLSTYRYSVLAAVLKAAVHTAGRQ
jgi:hypothetical protein